ncbi:unnamed protein product [Medioppia subpectinata]|uniref:PAP-associated domain-containing protein n=1 Tax=Medioppia subpectinata TaxID=1979941 RepID=A0A7R9Q1G3_9ACAR|nr:unnamed protein product [Medioppia subpectinata]CAG2109183.1 unnamed protein product [Medioppia subpectinata]
MDCFKKSAVESCDEKEYQKLKHCAFDFWAEHMNEGLNLYKNESLRLTAYKCLVETRTIRRETSDRQLCPKRQLCPEMTCTLNPYDQRFVDWDYIYNLKDETKIGDQFSQDLWHLYDTQSLHFKDIARKSWIRRDLSQCLTTSFAYDNFVDIFITGSTVNGFGTRDSDLDLCLVVSEFCPLEEMRKSDKLAILSEVEDIVCRQLEVEESQVIDARVPILRYIHPKTRIQVEINVNNEIGLKNSRLLYCYSKLDWRVAPICIAIKLWAKHFEIINSFSGSLSSYCVELMAIFYLQNTSPPLVPCLQETDSGLFGVRAEMWDYLELPDLKQLKSTSFATANEESLSELFAGFFRFYVQVFDFNRHVASVRLGRILEKQHFVSQMDSMQWQYICVEEPFSGHNAARTLYNPVAYDIRRIV